MSRALIGGCLVGAVLASAAVAMQGWTAREGRTGRERVPVVLELFTSEGCSSCPPADALLMELMAEQPVDGAFVVGLSQHVDYWNRLGWRDPFSAGSHSSRQSAYAARRGASQVYTPQMVADGGEGFVGSNRAAAFAAIRAAARRGKAPMAVTWNPAAATARIRLEPGQTTSQAGADIMMAVVEDGLRSEVLRGENSGRALRHDAVVRSLERVGRADDTGHFESSVRVHVDASWVRSRLRVVVMAQARDQGPVLAAASSPTAEVGR